MFYFYSLEIIFRFIYVIIGFILCSVVSIYNINWLLLFILYPLLNIFSNKFIVTHVTDFIDIIWVVVYSTSFLFVLPLTFYQLLNFFKSSWYVYQIQILKKISCWICVAIGITAFLCYLIFLPTTLNFLIYWEHLEQNNSILVIESEFRILDFIYWIFNFQFLFIFFIFFYLIMVMIPWVLFKIDKIYFIVKSYRKQLSFINLIFLFVLSPSEIFLQFFLIFFIMLFYEAVFFFVCYKISNLDQYAYNKSISKGL